MYTNETDRMIPVYWTGYENDGTTVIDADVPLGGCVCTVEGLAASTLDTTTGLQKVTRPASATLVYSRKYIVASEDNFQKVNALYPGSTTRRQGGVIYVWNPCHPANQEVYALVANGVSGVTPDTLIATYNSFTLADNNAADAADIEGSIVGQCRESNSSGADALRKIRLTRQ